MTIILFVILILCLFPLLLGLKARKRRRRPAFKRMYELDQVQPIEEFERKLIKGMFTVNKEVFVTAFVNETHVLKVTATIGSKYRCSASDDVGAWGIKARKLGATAIRQYHNHPDIFGRSFPSALDKTAHRELSVYINQWGVEYRSLLVYRSFFGFGKIKDYQ